jgi:hypothetical protein
MWQELDLLRIVAALSKYCKAEGANLYWYQTSNNWKSSLENRVVAYYSSDRRNSHHNLSPERGNYLKSWAWNPPLSARHLPFISPNGVKDIPCNSEAIQRLFFTDESDMNADINIDRNGKSLVLIPSALSTVIRWLEDPTFFRYLDMEDKAEIRGALRCQLHEVRQLDVQFRS